MKCSRCGRELKDPESISLGMGPVCRAKSHGSFLDIPIETGVILTRVNDASVTNVPRLVPGPPFDWGNRSPGAEALTLHILETVLRRQRHRGPVTKYFFQKAWDLAPKFMSTIEHVRYEGGSIPYQSIVEWMEL